LFYDKWDCEQQQRQVKFDFFYELTPVYNFFLVFINNKPGSDETKWDVQSSQKNLTCSIIGIGHTWTVISATCKLADIFMGDWLVSESHWQRDPTENSTNKLNKLTLSNI
jgi:hypothetical protein